MKLPRRNLLHFGASAVAFAALPRIATALDYPTRPVHVVVGYPPGGPPDIEMRLIAPWLSERMGQAFVVENRPGAGSNLATELVVRAPPDGHTLLMATASNSWNTALYDNLSFDFMQDIVPVAGISRDGGVIVVNPSVPAKTLPEFIAYAKANPGKINMGTAGVGSASHLYGELFKKMAGVDLLHVPYRGGGPAVVALLSGEVQVYFGPVLVSIANIRAGKLRPLGVTTTTRIGVLPDVPPISDAVPGYEAIAWFGIGAPKGTSAEIVGLLNKQVNAALGDPNIKTRLAELGEEPFATSPAEFRKFIVEYTDKWAKIIRPAGIKAG
jgi:tripartite-type tricarboxylate transporter receptor subunit TctC